MRICKFCYGYNLQVKLHRYKIIQIGPRVNLACTYICCRFDSSVSKQRFNCVKGGRSDSQLARLRVVA